MTETLQKILVKTKAEKDEQAKKEQEAQINYKALAEPLKREIEDQTTTACTRRLRSFREVFGSFSKFSSIRRLASTCSDLPGCVRTRSDALGSVRKHLDVFRNFSENVRACRGLCQIPAKPMMNCVLPRR